MSTVVLGTQEWDVDNLNVDTLGDGTAIPLVTDQTTWNGLTTPGRCYYNNSTDPVYQAKYGQLYNWYALNGIVPAALAAEGWRVPSEADLLALETWLIANGYNWDGTTTGNKIGKSMASKDGEWSASATTGHVGNNQGTNNSSGLTFLPSGARSTAFTGGGTGSYIYVAEQHSSTNAKYRTVFFNSALFNTIANATKSFGMSVRLVRDYVAPPAGDISGSTGIAFGLTGTLTGTADASGSTSIAFATTATATGTAEAAGATGITFGASGTLTGTADASGTTGIAFEITGTASEGGSVVDISGATGITFGITGTLTGTAEASGTTSITLDASATLTGTADASGATGITFTVSVFTGTISVPASRTIYARKQDRTIYKRR